MMKKQQKRKRRRKKIRSFTQRLSRLTCLSVTLLIVLALSPRLEAGKHLESYALIFGTVWQGDQPVYGVKIKIRRADEKKPHWELYSDHRGEFAQRVPAEKADYVVRAEAEPKKHAPRLSTDEVRVHIDGEERRDISLHLK